MSIFKIFLMLGLMMYTFVTMVGGNPDRDPYGFRYWRDPVRSLLFFHLLLLVRSQ
jgi:amino acid transporter